MAGRRPIPTKLKLLRGNPGKRRLLKGEPQPRNEMPEPPDFLGAVALAKWHSLAPELHRLGVLTILDATLLGLYCAMYARWRQAQEGLECEGLTTCTAEGRRLVSPYFQIGKDAFNMMCKLAVEFGLTPASRPKLARGEATPDDPLEVFLRNKKR